MGGQVNIFIRRCELSSTKIPAGDRFLYSIVGLILFSHKNILQYNCISLIHIEIQKMRTVEAIIDEEGVVHFVEPVGITGIHRALVIIFDDDPLSYPCETAQLSEKTLAEDWDNPGEDDAWKHLQQAQ